MSWLEPRPGWWDLTAVLEEGEGDVWRSELAVGMEVVLEVVESEKLFDCCCVSDRTSVFLLVVWREKVGMTEEVWRLEAGLELFVLVLVLWSWWLWRSWAWWRLSMEDRSRSTELDMMVEEQL